MTSHIEYFSSVGEKLSCNLLWSSSYGYQGDTQGSTFSPGTDFLLQVLVFQRENVKDASRAATAVFVVKLCAVIAG